ncbi:DNA-binding transcriptional regulator, LysR family [Rhizobium sp. AN5]|uniref:LysR family transcriptional regulator n=1 Tax=Rhizobium sp. AN5 TaxID=1855304 RepID=UPI000BC559EA|nr:LysR family transcriptional regulator [Rhizobium sp. AN5]SOC92275.1 DNA-binding transcriptional regulator, LysR family [Rhizobium sp. AN5]
MSALVQVLAVAEYLSFYRAAQALRTSQSSVSTRIKALEADLGIVLFDRNTRGVRLTEAGRRFVEQVNNAMSILDHAVKTAGMRARGEEGELWIGVHGLIAGGFLDRLVERFHGKYPNVRLHITEGTARDAQLMLREGKLDLVFMAGMHDIPDLNSRIIWHDRLMVALFAKHTLATRPDVEWRQLAEETFLVRYGGTGPQVHDLIIMRAAGRWPVPAIERYDVGRDTLLSMIAAGQGISLFAKENLSHAPSGIVIREITDELEAVAFSAVWSPSNRSQILRNFLGVAERMQKELDR